MSEYAELHRLAGDLHKSRLWKTGSVEQALAIILMGRELGIGPTTALSNIIISMGKPTLGAALVGALIQKSGRYGYAVTEMSDTGVSITFYENRPDGQQRQPLGVSTFTMQDAAKAGLIGGRAGAWGKYDRNMLLARAVTNGARWFCPSVFGGAVYDPEEFGIAGALAPPHPLEDDRDPEAPYSEAVFTPSSNADQATGETIEGLLERYSAEQIVAANEGRLPATDAELVAVAAKLRAGVEDAVGEREPADEAAVG
jgi:hypothetical protein